MARTSGHIADDEVRHYPVMLKVGCTMEDAAQLRRALLTLQVDLPRWQLADTFVRICSKLIQMDVPRLEGIRSNELTMAAKDRLFDIRSILLGIVATVVSGLLLQLALSYFSDKPRSELTVEYFPFVAPREFKEVGALSTHGFIPDAILQEIKKSDGGASNINEGTIRSVMRALKFGELAKREAFLD